MSNCDINPGFDPKYPARKGSNVSNVAPDGNELVILSVSGTRETIEARVGGLPFPRKHSNSNEPQICETPQLKSPSTRAYGAAGDSIIASRNVKESKMIAELSFKRLHAGSGLTKID